MEFLIIFWNDNSTSSRRSSLKEDVIPSRKNSNATSNPKVYSVDKRERGGEAKVEFALYFAFAPARGETRGSSDCRYGHWCAFHGKVVAAMSLSSTSLST